jgi:hypothetical protein
MHILWNCVPDHVFIGNESMNKGSSLSRQYLDPEGIVEVLDLFRVTKLKGYMVCTTGAVILELVFIGLIPPTSLSSCFWNYCVSSKQLCTTSCGSGIGCLEGM